MSQNLKQKVLPELLKEFEAGNLRANKIIKLLQITPDEFITAIQEYNIQCPITPILDEFTEKNLNEILESMKK